MYMNPKYKNVFFASMDGTGIAAPTSVSSPKAKANVKSKTLYEALYKYVAQQTNTIPQETNIVGLIDMLLTDNITAVEEENPTR